MPSARTGADVGGHLLLALLMRLGAQPPPGFESRSLRPDQADAAHAGDGLPLASDQELPPGFPARGTSGTLLSVRE
jgi:hypothetical protein